MRIFKFIITSLLLFFLIGIGGFLVIRESFLSWGVSSLEHSVDQLRSVSRSDTYFQECFNRGGGEGATQFDEAVRYQLRFLSSTEYVLEAVCQQFALNPIVISRHTLPNFVTKSIGTSGFLWGEGITNSVELVVFDKLEKNIKEFAKFDTSFITRKKSVVLANSEISTQPSPASGSMDGPVTSCQGYGYQCCDQTSQKGIGNQIDGTLGCSDNCFAECVSRPQVLAFNSNPFFDIKTRTLTLNTTTDVEMMYVASSADSERITGIIDFGDGNQMPIMGGQGEATHSYSCLQGNCQFNVKIKLIDKWGVESIDTPVSQFKIKFVN